MPHLAEAISSIELTKVNRAFQKLKTQLKPVLQDDDGLNIDAAFNLAVEAHKFQRRKSGEPYILHPIEVARICYAEIGLGPTAVISALLHDVVEDTDVTIEEIRKLFGDKIAKIVDGLTKLDGLYNVESPQAENLKKVLSTLVYDVRVVLIKMADRIHNLRTIGPMPRHKQLKIAAETSFIYAPLAHRLGLYQLKTEFEDICMKITEPDTYADIESKIFATQQERSKYIKEFIKPLNHSIKELDFPFRVTGRPKSISSIWNKIQNKNVPFEEIYDLFAVRIIVDVPRNKEKSVCWQVYSVITDVYKPIPERLKDWVTSPKGNGYESLHTTVIGPMGKFVEVQIRSERMDEIAEKGFAAHWKYKGVKDQNDVYNSWLNTIRETLDEQHTTAIEFLSDFKSNLYGEEVYGFTPKGDMKILPKGASALDFAFAIHTDVGYHATGIKVNNKLVPMGYVISNGDQIHVTTSKNQKPNEDWLKLVVTSKAKAKIRSAMKEDRKKKGELGKEDLERKLKNKNAHIDENVDMLVKYYGLNSRADLFYSIATEQVKLTDLKKFEVVLGKLQVKKSLEETTPIQAPEPIQTHKIDHKNEEENKNLILINGEPASQYKFFLSQCCNPVPGDSIFAYTSSLAGLKIHRTNCPNATNLMAHYGYRILKAEWAGMTSQNFVADLLITGTDTGPGVIRELSNVISDQLGINIRSFSIEGKEGYYEGRISLLIRNKDQLSQAIRTLEAMENISTVVRLNNPNI